MLINVQCFFLYPGYSRNPFNTELFYVAFYLEPKERLIVHFVIYVKLQLLNSAVTIYKFCLINFSWCACL